MVKPYTITITNGEGSGAILNGQYTVSADVTGYNVDSIDPKQLTVVEGTNTYTFEIEAAGTLTLLVTEDGLETGTPIAGAKFYRTDSTGTEISAEYTSNDQGYVTIEHVPFAATGAPTIYYKQTASDGDHEFDSTVKNITLTTQTQTVLIENTPAVERIITLTDKYFADVDLNGTITLN